MFYFVRKVIVFLTPFIFILITEYVVDPFNYFNDELNPYFKDLKEDISQKTNSYLYKLIKYERNPTSNILLGDSRIALLKTSFFENNNNEKYSNFGIGGSTLQDAIEIFWITNNINKLNRVYFGISIETYSGTFLRERVTPSVEIKNSTILYLLNRYSFSATFLILRTILFDEKIDLFKPPTSIDKFWENQLEKSNRFLENYSYPHNYYNELKNISDYCNENDIQLTFIISPTHIDLQNKISDYKLNEQYDKFIEDIKLLGDVFDFNFPNSITIDKKNFKDPFHHNDSISKVIIDEIMYENSKIAKVYFQK